MSLTLARVCLSVHGYICVWVYGEQTPSRILSPFQPNPHSLILGPFASTTPCPQAFPKILSASKCLLSAGLHFLKQVDLISPKTLPLRHRGRRYRVGGASFIGTDLHTPLVAWNRLPASQPACQAGSSCSLASGYKAVSLW